MDAAVIRTSENRLCGSDAFGEYQISDDSNFIRHVEYMHYNPVKHCLVKFPAVWPHSTFHRYVKQGIYHSDWGADKEIAFDQGVGNE